MYLSSLMQMYLQISIWMKELQVLTYGQPDQLMVVYLIDVINGIVYIKSISFYFFVQNSTKVS